MKSIIWLASYPKSGNTWTRVFLANYLLKRETPLPINELKAFGATDTNVEFYRRALKKGFRPDDHHAHLKVRPGILRGIARNGADLNFLKTHNINAAIFGAEMIPVKLTRAAVFIVRNPLDVAISYSRHYGLSMQETIRSLANPNNSTSVSETNVKNFLSTWSEHTLSWLGSRGFPLLVQRYEDMKKDPHATFTKLLEHLGLPIDFQQLDRAIAFSSIKEMQKQEAEAGFAERSANSERFFHTGTSGQWKSALTPDQAKEIRKHHGAVMARLGYF